MSGPAALLERLRPRRAAEPPPPVLVGSHTDRLSRLRPVAHDPDERPRREDPEAARPRRHWRMLG